MEKAGWITKMKGLICVSNYLCYQTHVIIRYSQNFMKLNNSVGESSILQLGSIPNVL